MNRLLKPSVAAAVILIVVTGGIVAYASSLTIGVNLRWSHGISGVVHVAVSSDGQYIAAASAETGAYVFTADGNLLWHDSPKMGEGFKSVAISSDGKYVVAGQDDEAAIGRAAVYLYAAQNGSQLWKHDTGGLVWSVAVSSDGKYIVAGSWDHSVYLFSRDSEKPMWNYEARAGVKSVAVSSDGQYIAAAGYDGLYMFNRFSGKPLWNYSQYGAFNTVAISSDGHYVAAGSSGDNSILLFKRDGAVLWRNPIGGEPLSVAISSDGEYVVAGSEGSAYSVHAFNRDDGPLWTYRVGAAVESVAISSDNQCIIAGSDDQMIHMFRRDNQTPLWNQHFENIVWSVGLSSNGQSVAAGAAGSVYIFAVSLSWTLFLAETLIAIGLSAVAVSLARKQLRVARYLWGCLNRRSFRAGLAGTLFSAGFVSALSASIWRMIIAALGITVMLTVGLTLVFCPFIILLLSRRKPLHSAISSSLGIVLAIGLTCAAISVLALVGAI